ncbi:hypothetical protein M9M90_09765 [Phenylobacterium sp. LH3H17]|uniref:AbiU2 domain-containing protein n=1 Tax=Phenylobacterium sp. LH3H17 TaxID=2903901 RepID=UPI0020C9EFF3|nr:hypothetical protein [Phenylobacterium sp. LH3H17]UTP41439.1 hypothetical protein M9M90_09765 [Phenylobacterium sp. LH3H17]
MEMMTRNVIMAAIHHDLWSLHIHKTTWDATETYRETMIDLWAANSLAHRYSFYVRAAAAYAQGPKVNGIPRLMRECRGKLSPEAAVRLTALFAEAKPLADKIEGLRNTVYAHQSARMRVEEAYAEARISLDMAQRLMVISIDIMNEMRAAVGLGATEVSRSHIDQFERTMAAIAKF